jgi:hypothetical protein
MRRMVIAGVAVMALAAPASAVHQGGHDVTSPRTSETPGTVAAQMQVETGRSITDPDKYLAYVKSLGDYEHARAYGGKH